MSTDNQHRKVLILTYYWPPAGGPGVQRWVKFSKYLSLSGYEPYIITVDDKYASYALKDFSLEAEVPGGIHVFRTRTRELYSAYLKISKKENIPFSGFVNESKPGIKQKIIRFLRSNLFIPDPRRGWNRYAYRKAIQLIHQENISILITTSPPHSTQLIGRKLKRLFPSINWIADFRDPWTDIFYFNELCHSLLSKGINQSMERSVLSSADKVVVVSHSMKKDFIKSAGTLFSPDKISVLSNGYDEEDFVRRSVPSEEVFTITYTGTLASNYKIDALLEAVREIIKTAGINLCIRFIGEVCPEYQSALRSPDLSETVKLIPRVGHEAAVKYLLSSHALLLVIPQAQKNEAILTGKIFEYMAAEKPIIGIGPVQGDAAVVLNNTCAGKMFDYYDTRKIYDFLLDLIIRHDKGEKLWQGQNTEMYSRKNLTKQFIQLF